MRIIILLGAILLITSFSSCDTYQKVLKSTDFDYKYEKSKEYYNQGEYYKAIPLLEELRAVYVGTKDVEKINYFYAFSHFGQGDYKLASYYFKGFTEYYPKSVYVEHASFMVGYCHYKMSPKTTLEQTSTLKAVEAFQLFLNNYPETKRKDQTNALIDELRVKLEEKAFQGAELYFNIKSYKAAIKSLHNLLDEFPDTKRKEEINFLILRSHFLYAQNSISTKQEERFGETIASYYEFIDQYPSSSYAKDAERFYTVSLKNLEKIKADE